MKVLILGAGAGGAAAVAELSLAGHEITLWNRSADTLAPFKALGGVAYDGVLGTGVAVPRLITANLLQAIAGVDVGVVALPTFSHAPVAISLAQAGWPADRQGTPAAHSSSPMRFAPYGPIYLPLPSFPR